MNPYAEIEPTIVKISTPADILGVLPHRLGFHPAESLVVVCLHGPRRRDRLVMRYDLPDNRHDSALCDEVVSRLVQRGADGAVIVCYTEMPARSGLARAPLFRALRRALRRADIEVMEALLVRDGRWWSYICRGGSCCPATGTPLPAEPTAAARHYAAESVAIGSVVLGDREQIVASIEPPAAVDDDSAAVGDRGVLDAVDVHVPGDPDTRCDVIVETVLRLVRRWERGLAEIEASSAAVVIRGLHEKVARDKAMTLVLDHDAHLLTALFIELARRARDEDAAPVCTVLAWFAYATGGGALTRIAIERALRAEPGYSMALLLEAGLDAMHPPSRIYEIAERVRAELAEAAPQDRAS